MNYIEILQKMEELGITPEVFSGEERNIKNAEYKNASMFLKNELTIEGLGKIVTVHQVGGYHSLQDGAYGMEWEIVRHFVEHNVYINLGGYYSSYDGLELDDEGLTEVFPKEKIIVVYESK